MRKMANKVPGLLLSVLAAAILSAGPAMSKSTIDITDAGSSARVLGLGKAFTAVAGDPSSIFVNPAGLSTINSVDLTTMYTTYMDDMKLTLLGGTYPVPGGVMGFGYAGNFSGDTPVTTIDASGRVIDTGSRMNYSANQLVVSYATRFGGFPILFESMKNMAFGVSGKIYLQNMTGPGGGTASGFDVDAGLLYKHRNGVMVSVLAKNMLPSTGGQLGTLVWSTGGKDGIPSVLKFGTNIKVLGSDGLINAGGQQLDAAVDLDTDMASGKPALFHAGVEWKPVEMLALRTGLDQEQAVGTDTRVSNNGTFGIGLKIGNIGFDYAYRAYSALAENSAHYFSFNISNILGAKTAVSASVEAKAATPPAAGAEKPAVKARDTSKAAVKSVKPSKQIKAKKAAPAKKSISKKPAKKKTKAVKKYKKIRRRR